MGHADIQELVATTLIDLGFAKARSQRRATGLL